MDELFSSDELARVQTAAMMLGVSPQEFLRRAAMSLAAALLPEGALPAASLPMKRGLTSSDL